MNQNIFLPLLNNKVMKKIILSLVFISSSALMIAQEVSNKQFVLVSKKTADWCSLCGGWGWNFFNNISEDLKDDSAVLLALHTSGGLATATSLELHTNFPGGGQPRFYVDREFMGVTSINASEKRDELVQVVKDLSAFPPLAGIGITATYDNGTVQIDVKSVFKDPFNNAEMYLALYDVRDNLIWTQNGQGSNASHKHVLRNSLTDNTYGELLRSGPIASGEEFSMEMTLEDFELHSDNIEDVKILAVLWNKRSDHYAFINANIVPLTQETSSVETIDDFSKNIQVKQLSDMMEINILNQSGNETYSIKLLDLSGRLVYQSGNRTNESIVIIPTGQLYSGVYILTAESEGRLWSQKLALLR
jgi:hypothetical protein